MIVKELIALGTSSQVPTRDRSHNAYFVRWNRGGVLFDPGEGTQRQMTLAGLPGGAVRLICISHFHGDHCLGLPGVVQRLSVETCRHPVHILFPESGRPYVEHLCSGAIYKSSVELVLHPVADGTEGLTEILRTDDCIVKARSLEHSVPTLGFRLEEPEGIRFHPEKLKQAGVQGTMVGELKRHGRLAVGDRTIFLEDMSEPREGTIFAFVMDTRPCPGALELGRAADLLLMEATFLDEHRKLAERYFHSTASDAGRTARDAGVGHLALGHFSQRYPDTRRHLEEAEALFPRVAALNDLDRIEIRGRERRAPLSESI